MTKLNYSMPQRLCFPNLMTCTSYNEITRLQNFSINIIINIIFIAISVIVTCTSLCWSLLTTWYIFSHYTSAMQYWSRFRTWVQYALSSQSFQYMFSILVGSRFLLSSSSICIFILNSGFSGRSTLNTETRFHSCNSHR